MSSKALKKGRAKKFAKLEAAVAVEDLDLDISDVDERTRYDEGNNDSDDDVVHNRRAKKKTGRRQARHEDSNDDDDSGNELDVLPSDAHKMDGYGDEEFGGAGGGSYQEEEDIAVATGKTMRKRASDDDFVVTGVTLGSVKAAASAAKKRRAELDAAPVIEAVERDFASLTTSERLAILKKESPELLKMLDDVKRYLAEVKGLAKPLHELIHERKVSDADRNLVSFLETKVQLMLSYCMHVTFYLLLKSEGKKVSGHPVVDNLVEIRVYLEKMWPLEEKLQYSLNRLLSGKAAAAAHVDELRPLQGSDTGVYEATRSAGNAEARERRKQMRDIKEAEELEREEQSAMTRVRSKKASALNALTSTSVAPLSYQEDEDQYFAKMTGRDLDDDDDAGLSLMDALRKRQRQQQEQQVAKKVADKKRRGAANEDDELVAESEEDDEGEMDEEDMLAMEGEDGEDMDDGDDEEAEYDALFDEERERKEEKADRDAAPHKKFTVQELARRKVGKRIESHRGLTKARPKDRKTPRIAQRRKYERGLRVHKAQSKSYQPEPEGGFSGVRSIKPGVVRGKSLL